MYTNIMKDNFSLNESLTCFQGEFVYYLLKTHSVSFMYVFLSMPELCTVSIVDINGEDDDSMEIEGCEDIELYGKTIR